jgi:DNA-binding Xre family transcriptional regulator
MIKPNIKEIAEKNGITTAYQLQKLLGIQPSLAAKWYKNDLKMIGFDSLNTLCKAFNCLPSELVVFTPDNDAEAANDTKSSNAESDITNVQNTFNSKIKGLSELSDKDDMWLSTKQIAEYTNRDERTVRDFYKNDLPFVPTNKGNFAKFSDLSVFLKNRNPKA